MKECVNKEVVRTLIWVGVFSEGNLFITSSVMIKVRS